MKEIIIDLDKLREPVYPLEFLTSTGTDKTVGEPIIKDIKDIMDSDKTILALSAPQIGINIRIFCIRFNDTIKTFINPIVTKKAGIVIAPETSVSMPGKEILISRPQEVTVVYYTDEFKYEENKLIGPAARVFDQMAQFLDGIVPDTLGLVSDVAQDGSLADLTEEEMNEVVDFYKTKFIPARMQLYKDSVSAEEQKAFDQLKLAEDIINGRAKIVESEAEVKARINANKQAVKSVAMSGRINQLNKKAENRAQLAHYLQRKK